MVATISSTSTPTSSSNPTRLNLNSKTTPKHATPNRTRLPLLPSEPENNNHHNAIHVSPNRRPKSRQVTSRYLSSSTSTPASSSKRSASPVTSRPAMMTPLPSSHSLMRSQSAERRRPGTPTRTNPQVPHSQRMLISSTTTTTRSLSVSFQGDSFPFQVSKAKKKPSPSPSPSPSPIGARRRSTTPTPKRVDQTENPRPAVAEQHRWPGRSRQNLPPEGGMSRSVDYTEDRTRVVGSSEANPNVIRELHKSLLVSVERRLSSGLGLGSGSGSIGIGPKKSVDDGGVRCEGLREDSESVSSGGSTSEGSGNNAGGVGQRAVRGIVVPARFWQETNGRLRRQSEQPCSPGSRIGLKGPVLSKSVPPKKLGIDSPVYSPTGVVNRRGQLSPIRSATMRPASPSKLGVAASPAASSPSMRGVSPSRVRNGVAGVAGGSLSNSSTNVPSILSFAVDIRRGKVGENRIVEMHFLRILYNRLLQWRFINARADTAISIQRLNAEKSLYNARITTSKLHESVRTKRSELQQLRQNLKLISILKGQMVFLDELELIDQGYSRSLLGAIEALRASTLRLPVVCGARADVQNVKDAISSAVDVLQAMASSICILLAKVAEANSLVSELANVIKKEGALLNHCMGLMSTLASMQVKEYSLRTHILQLKRAPMGLMTEA